MKKSIAALMLCGAVFAGMTVSAFADDTEEVTALDYSMIDESVYEGGWVTVLDTFDLYLPLDWDVLVDVAAGEEAEDNVYFTAANEDQTISASVSYAEGEVGSIEDIYNALAETMDDVKYVVVNDLACVAYEVQEDGVFTGGIATFDDAGGVYNLTVGCTEDVVEDANATLTNILVSFSLTEETNGADSAEEAAE